MILGDLNTMGHSVARLSPNYCCDHMRWGSLGSCEAAWWQRNVLAVTGGGNRLAMIERDLCVCKDRDGSVRQPAGQL